MRCILCFMAILLLVVPAANVEADERVITHVELLDKLSGFWIGQILGNYMGFPFENNYVEEPVPVFVDRIYTYADDPNLDIDRHNRKGFVPIKAVPNEGPFAEGMRDVVKWHKQYDNWRDTRQKIHKEYYRYKKGSYEAPVSKVSSLQKGLIW